MAMEPAGRLNSWKEIAAYLGVTTRTAQRWERAENLPARRHKHEVLSSVFAYPSELDVWWQSRPDLNRAPRATPDPARSIAVLPFVNLNRDEENEVLSDGLTEELINGLAQVEGLRVVARTSAFYYKGRADDIRAVGARLGVQTILEGSLRRAADRLLITAQLIHVSDGCHIWSERFDRRTADLFDLQEEIARAIVDALQVKLGVDRINRQYGQELAIHEMYLGGRYHSNRRTGAGFLRAVECFEQVLAKDSRMARAWAGLAECHAFLGPLAGIPFAEAMSRAKAAARKALEIDGDLPDAHCSLGFVYAVFEYDWQRSQDHFRQALQLQPCHANSHMCYGAHVLAPLGRLVEAAVHARRACELDPLSPPAMSGLAGSWLMLRQPDQAVSACNTTLDLTPDFPLANRFLGEAYLLKNMVDEAAAAFSRIESPVIAAGFLGYTHARSGRPDEARRILRELERTASTSGALQIAAVHLGLDDRDSAFNWLRRACAERSMGVHWLKVEPIWDPLRSDPRFTALLGEMRLSDS